MMSCFHFRSQNKAAEALWLEQQCQDAAVGVLSFPARAPNQALQAANPSRREREGERESEEERKGERESQRA